MNRYLLIAFILAGLVTGVSGQDRIITLNNDTSVSPSDSQERKTKPAMTGSFPRLRLALSGGAGYLYETTPRFIFVNKEGTALYVLKTLKQDFDSDSWFMETIEL